MLCTDIQIPAGEPERAFIKARTNWLITKKSICRMAAGYQLGGDVLKAYRAGEMIRLIEETGHIEMMVYELMMKTLDHILIGMNLSMEVVFMTGTRVRINEE